MPIKTDNNQFLVVPIKVDALFVGENGHRVVDPLVDFSRLPYQDGEGNTINYDEPYTSETVMSKPFSNENNYLEPGIHLHWALPDALTYGHQWEEEMKFPAVPNRWMVVRQESTHHPEKKWLVLSDYLWPEGSVPVANDRNTPEFRVTYHHKTPNEESKYPFRYQGRVVELKEENLEAIIQDGGSLQALTALGYGEPLFAAFYPSCQGIFGMRDKDIISKDNLKNITYEVYGWYSDSDNDPLKIYTKIFNDNESNQTRQEIGKDALGDQPDLKWLKAIQDEFGWTISKEELPALFDSTNNTILPPQIMCFAKLSFNLSTAGTDATDLSIAIGNTGTEALSALLANKIKGTKKLSKSVSTLEIEDILESLHLRKQFQDQQADLWPTFEEARHTKSFQSVSGGQLWKIRPQTTKEVAADETPKDKYEDQPIGRYFLPSNLEEQLHQINILQKHFNKGQEGIRSLQKQIFADWHKYMRTSYHDPDENYRPGTSSPTFPDIDAARKHTEKLMDLLKLKQAFVGKLNYTKNERLWGFEVELEEFPLAAELIHLIPETNSAFLRWMDQYIIDCNHNKLAVSPPSLAENIANRLNRMAIDLQTHNRIILKIQGHYTDLITKTGWTLSQQENDENNLFNLAKAIDHWFNIPKKLLVLPNIKAATFIQSIIDDATLTGNEKINIAKEALTALLKPLRTLPILELQATPAPRYWQPNEPVILMAGPKVESTDRHGFDNKEGLLVCPSGSLDLPAINNFEPSTFLTTIQYLLAEGFGKNISNGNPWHCLFLEWEVGIHPVHLKSNLETGNLSYNTDFITDNYNLNEKRPEFEKNNKETISSTSYFSGRSIFTPHAEESLKIEINIYQAKKTLDYLKSRKKRYPPLNDTEKALLVTRGAGSTLEKYTYFTTHKAAIIKHRSKVASNYKDRRAVKELKEIGPKNKRKAANRVRKYLQERLDNQLTKVEGNLAYLSLQKEENQQQVLDYFETHKAEIIAYQNQQYQYILRETGRTLKDDNADLNDIIDAAKEQLGVLEHIQSQELTGFNNAMQMLHQTLQIEIAEPNGFEEYAAFSSKVATAVDKQNALAALPFVDFHPLRSGKFKVYRLRLVDSFGRVHWITDHADDGRPTPTIYTPERMKAKAEDGEALLLPRISQPARLHFRWLDADRQELESNAHPNTSPICGWVLTNHIDHSLMVYAAEGTPLGYIDNNGHWQLFPGRKQPILPEDIDNTALKNMVVWFINEVTVARATSDNMQTLIKKLDQIMENIDPDSYAQHQARSLLMGRPIALVQAVVNLELKGWPAVHQEMNLYKWMLQGENETYQTDGFTEVNIPIRIGEHERLNDGVVGYWVADDTLESPKDRVFRTSLQKLTFEQSITAPPQRLAILMDPRGVLHCTTGILPTKALSIPKEHYVAILQKLQITFLATPLLSNPRSLNIGLPEEPGFSWSWMQKEGYQWTTLTQRAIIKDTDLYAAFDNGEGVWRLLQNKGWIDPLIDHPHLASLRPDKERGVPNLFEEGETDEAIQAKQQKMQKDIEHVLQIIAMGIQPPLLDANFGPTSEIREGWLTLTPTN